MQWQLYEGVNITNDLMRNAYQRAMLFLTYIQGPLVNKWVKGVNAWLQGQVIRQRWLTTDERLWDEVGDSFNRQFTNVMEQENTQAKLAAGLKLERGDLSRAHHRIRATSTSFSIRHKPRIGTVRFH
jgi:hypothetical protein